jgi:flagellar biosynthesis protein
VNRPRQLAAALRYHQDDPGAPVIIASGRGSTAERICDTARQAGVPVCEDQALAGILTSLEIGTEIPPQLFQAVAQIIAFVWRLDQEHRQSRSPWS